MLLINFGIAARGGIRPITINAASYLPGLTTEIDLSAMHPFTNSVLYLNLP